MGSGPRPVEALIPRDITLRDMPCPVVVPCLHMPSVHMPSVHICHGLVSRGACAVVCVSWCMCRGAKCGAMCGATCGATCGAACGAMCGAMCGDAWCLLRSILRGPLAAVGLTSMPSTSLT